MWDMMEISGLSNSFVFHLKKLIREQNYTCVHIHADVANKLMVSGMAARTAESLKLYYIRMQQVLMEIIDG